MEYELGLTALFNNYLAGLANAILGIFNIKPENPLRPWDNSLVMELLVVALLIGLFYFSPEFRGAVLNLAHSAGWGPGTGLR